MPASLASILAFLSSDKSGVLNSLSATALSIFNLPNSPSSFLASLSKSTKLFLLSCSAFISFNCPSSLFLYSTTLSTFDIFSFILLDFSNSFNSSLVILLLLNFSCNSLILASNFPDCISLYFSSPFSYFSLPISTIPNYIIFLVWCQLIMYT